MMKKGQRYNRGFTLIELLVVLAISMVLMGLVLYPVTQSFKMTRSAQAMVESQDAARFAMEQISRDLGEAMDIVEYENAQPLQIPVLQSDGITVEFLDVPNAKIDFVLPKMIAHCNNPDHPVDATDPTKYPRDFERGDEALPSCPVCDSTDVEIRPGLPLQPDTKVVRYFLGLMYNNPDPHDGKYADPDAPDFGWLSPWAKNVEAGAGNQVVLYRIEFDSSDETIFGTDKDIAVAKLKEILEDPRFFYSDESDSSAEPFWHVWARKARVVGVGKYEDLVEGVDSDGDGNWNSLTPCVTFNYKKMDNDDFSGTYSSDQSYEYPDAVPAIYQAEYGYWMPDDYDISVYRYTYDSNNSPSVINEYAMDLDDGSTHVVINKRVYTASTETWSSPVTTFDITQYNTDLTNNGKVLPGTIGSGCEMAFTIDTTRGRVNFAITPPTPDDYGSISDLDPAAINYDYTEAYRQDRGTARRGALLSTFKSGSDNYLEYATIVPGSERVTGPDMTPNSSSSYVTYQRVPFALGEPGYNQYKVDYDNGRIYFSSVYEQALPEDRGKIYVNYKVRFNRDGDVVRGNYRTRAAVVVHLQMKMYDPESAKPHSVDLTNTIKVRNALR
ncbi:prepilin-type N-terminal cleavage/methylation domain-containing protein [bacterium]|nr:prepilin-type N-terminal cleavage/methylation domain-containing protein [bacterium]